MLDVLVGAVIGAGVAGVATVVGMQRERRRADSAVLDALRAPRDIVPPSDVAPYVVRWNGREAHIGDSLQEAKRQYYTLGEVGDTLEIYMHGNHVASRRVSA